MPKSSDAKSLAWKVVEDIRRKTRRHFSAEDKPRIMLEVLSGDDSIAQLCRNQGIAQPVLHPVERVHGGWYASPCG